MKFKIFILVLFLLFISINSIHANDVNISTSLLNETLHNYNDSNTINLIESDYNVNDTIFIDDELTITSNHNVNITANSNSIFNISSSGKLTLINLTFKGASDVEGGAIYNNGTLVLINCKFIENTANYGGAIYNNGILKIDNCTFDSNTVSIAGGAIYSLSNDVLIENSAFINNIAKTSNGELKGGSIYNSGNNFTVISCLFSKNGVYNTYWYENGNMYGGSIYNSGNNLTILNSKFNENYIYGYTNSKSQHVDLSSKYGAAIYSSNCFNVVNNTFDSNEIYSMLSTYGSSKVECSNRGYASAIYANSKIYVINNTFVNNKAAYSPLYIRGNDNYIEGNTFYNNTMRFMGQAIYISGHNSYIIRNTFNSNNGGDESLDGAAIYINYGGNETFLFNYFNNSNGIYYYNGLNRNISLNASIENNVFANSSIAISLYDTLDVKINGNQFIDNNISINTYIGDSLQITNNYFKGGNSCNAGTAINLNSNNVLINGNVFDDVKSNIYDSPKGSQGGIIYIKVRENITISDNYFINCEVGNNSGLIHSLFGEADIVNNYFANNNVHEGGLIQSETSQLFISKNIFEENLGKMFLFQSYYHSNTISFIENAISNFTGDLKDYYIEMEGTVIEDELNEKYMGNSSSILENIQYIVDSIISEFYNAFNNINSPSNPPETNSSEISNSTLDEKYELSNSTIPEIDYSNENNNEKTEITTINSVGLNENNLNEYNEQKEMQTSPSASASEGEDNKKAYQITKNINNMSNMNSLIFIIIIIMICGLLIIGYKMKK